MLAHAVIWASIGFLAGGVFTLALTILWFWDRL